MFCVRVSEQDTVPSYCSSYNKHGVLIISSVQDSAVILSARWRRFLTFSGAAVTQNI